MLTAILKGLFFTSLGINHAAWAEVIAEKPLKPIMTDQNGSEWFQDKDGDQFIWDEKFRRPLYKSAKGDFYIKDHKVKKFSYGLLCNPDEKENHGFYGDAFSELTRYPKKYKYQFTLYYQDVQHLINIFSHDNCPAKKDGEEMVNFLSQLQKTCEQSCTELAPSYHSNSTFFKESKIKKQVSECLSVCEIYMKRQQEKLLEANIPKKSKNQNEIQVDSSSRILNKPIEINSPSVSPKSQASSK